jgi:sterol desaturase/sphingolipid hydroxylase (fatty acid hydroxylase superfamily)
LRRVRDTGTDCRPPSVGKSMRLTKASYFADFVVYPPVTVTLIVTALRSDVSLSWKEPFIACLAGIILWTFLEYVVHRFALHRIPYLAAMHDLHHDNPRGFVGTPTWLSLSSICCGALLPLWGQIGFSLAGTFSAGLMLGYLWYGATHYIIHHWRIEPGNLLYTLKRRHVLHHYARKPCNYGVTSSFWDRVFGTALSHR